MGAYSEAVVPDPLSSSEEDWGGDTSATMSTGAAAQKPPAAPIAERQMESSGPSEEVWLDGPKQTSPPEVLTLDQPAKVKFEDPEIPKPAGHLPTISTNRTRGHGRGRDIVELVGGAPPPGTYEKHAELLLGDTSRPRARLATSASIAGQVGIFQRHVLQAL